MFYEQSTVNWSIECKLHCTGTCWDCLACIFLAAGTCLCSRRDEVSLWTCLSWHKVQPLPRMDLTSQSAAVCCRSFMTWCERSAHGRWMPSDKTTASRRSVRRSGNVPFCNVWLACTCEGSEGLSDSSSRLRLWTLVITASQQPHHVPRERLNSLRHHPLEPSLRLVWAPHPWGVGCCMRLWTLVIITSEQMCCYV